MLRLVTSLMGRSIGQDTILPAKMTNHCKTLIPMGAGLVMGLEGRPLFTRPLEVSRHLQRLRTTGRRDGRRGNGLSRHRRKPDTTGRTAPSRNATQRRRRTGDGARQKEGPSALRCTTARTSMRHPQYRMAGGAPPFKWWTRGQRMGARSHTPYASHHNTRAHGNAGRRHTSGGERRGCARHTDTHRAERARWHTGEYGTAVPEGTRGTRGCLRCAPLPRCEPPPHCAAWGRAEPARGLQGGGGGGATPSPQEARDAHAGEGGGAHTRGARRPEPVPPPARGGEATEGRGTSPGRPAGQTSTPAGAAWACRH